MKSIKEFDAPCSVCGYNGPGFYQPETHHCVKTIVERNKRMDNKKESEVHIMIDFETLSPYSFQAPVIAIGAYAFQDRKSVV